MEREIVSWYTLGIPPISRQGTWDVMEKDLLSGKVVRIPWDFDLPAPGWREVAGG